MLSVRDNQSEIEIDHSSVDQNLEEVKYTTAEEASATKLIHIERLPKTE